MNPELMPLLSGISAFLFLVVFSSSRWEESREGRNLIFSALVLGLTGTGVAFNVSWLEVVGWVGLIIAMVWRTHLFIRAQRAREQLRRDMQIPWAPSP